MNESETTSQNVPKWQTLLLLAQELAERSPGFFVVQGAGKGDTLTNSYMAALTTLARDHFGEDYGQRKICHGTKFCVDFYFPDEATVVELALSARNPISEYERDLFKVMLAKDAGHSVDRLVFISRPGAWRKLNEPGAKAIADFVRRHMRIEIVVEELVNSAKS